MPASDHCRFEEPVYGQPGVARNCPPRMKRYAPRAAQVLVDTARKRPRPGTIAGSVKLQLIELGLRPLHDHDGFSRGDHRRWTH